MDDKCIECNGELKRIKFPTGNNKIAMKCIKQGCSLCYVLNEVSSYDIGRWEIRGPENTHSIIKDGAVQVFLFYIFFCYFVSVFIIIIVVVVVAVVVYLLFLFIIINYSGKYL
jgi:hypothetical protein